MSAAQQPLRAELKRMDTVGLVVPSELNESSGQSFVLLNGIQAGSGTFQRLGRKVNMKSLAVKCHWQPNINPLNEDMDFPDYTCRFMIIYDREAEENITFGDVIQNVDETGVPSIEPTAFPNIFNKERFLILRDKAFSFPAGTVVRNGTTNKIVSAVTAADTTNLSERAQIMCDKSTGDAVIWQEYIKLKGLEATYKSTSNPMTIANFQTGALYIVLWADISLSGPTNEIPWMLRFDARTSFLDS